MLEQDAEQISIVHRKPRAVSMKVVVKATGQAFWAVAWQVPAETPIGQDEKTVEEGLIATPKAILAESAPSNRAETAAKAVPVRLGSELMGVFATDKNATIKAARAAMASINIIGKIRGRNVRIGGVIIDPEPSALDTMRRNLSHDDVVERIVAARALAQDRYPEAVHDVTRQLWQEDRAEVRYWLVQALGSAGGDDAVQALTAFGKTAAAQNPLLQSRINENLGTARRGGLRFAAAGRQGGRRYT